ncbi:hypothetical protein [Komagataeibacter europaeus]|uniref:hypothetical protein n=1 Tax=Komagataeibacter europaeus TaxID=33995 RepID=UPI0012FBD53D|nr:hypothetical protein [Komagataeibacter europaeus]GBQ38867.1 hypothetical protein AA18890_0280 [Komagataeibacter europaeus LMG 18890]
MTTNVIDLDAGQLACDTRWSVDGPGFIVFVDDTGFEKISVVGNWAFVFAGNGALIEAWKRWLGSDPTTRGKIPPVSVGTGANTNSIALHIANITTSKLEFFHGTARQYGEEAYFAGSGGLYAYNCWSANRDAIKAVATAQQSDRYSGGSTRYLAFSDRTNNLNETATLHDTAVALKTKGKVMYSDPKAKEIPVVQAAANDAKVQQVLDQVSSGALAPSAPCEAMYREWAPQEVEELHTVLDKIFKG